MDATAGLNSAFSYIITYTPDGARGEHRNVALALVASGIGYAGIRHLPPSLLSRDLREQGLLDGCLVSLARAISERPFEAAERLGILRANVVGPLSVSEPIPTDTQGIPEAALARMFKALVGRGTRRRVGHPRREILDHAVSSLRGVGADVRVGEYLGDFLLDAIVQRTRQPAVVMHAQSFDTERDWARVEHETAHFLFAVDQLKHPAICVLQPPVDDGRADALASYDRVQRWLGSSTATVVTPKSMPTVAVRYGSPKQLELVLST
jgi:hypothetical protein